ncbi:KTSC domain-containing protein [Mesorhizobium sp.]|uniref:KTSC domain-containing protein n=1 Tax=Mesorhizobium sp. TaxID=1871066 RepID=UPI000FE5B3D7|nr:MAG: KTSC domain-containing protein [Mesorhizobium sp.]RWQ39203.1 MAG: KTSC domain-containing protein [Mesorhizobium sp.]
MHGSSGRPLNCRAGNQRGHSKTEYDPDRRTLSVWFVASGKCYQFEDVPPETFAEFRAAFAKGRFFNERIRNRFRYRLVGTANNSG